MAQGHRRAVDGCCAEHFEDACVKHAVTNTNCFVLVSIEQHSRSKVANKIQLLEHACVTRHC